MAIPAVSDDGVVTKWNEIDGGGGSKGIERIKNRDYNGSLYMVNKPPRWNDQVHPLREVFVSSVKCSLACSYNSSRASPFQNRVILRLHRVSAFLFGANASALQNKTITSLVRGRVGLPSSIFLSYYTHQTTRFVNGRKPHCFAAVHRASTDE